MLSALSKKPKEITFSERVTRFWEWFSAAGDRFRAEIEAKRCPGLAGEVSAKVDELFPHFAWEFGPGENGGQSFTLSGEGDQHRQILGAYWKQHGPVVPGWTFFASRQPCAIEGQKLTLGEKSFDPLEFWLVPHVDAEEEKVDISVLHPLFKTMDERSRWTVLFLYLDMALGELGTQSFVGKIDFSDQHLGEAIPMTELRNFVHRVATENEWKEQVPGQTFSLFSFESLPDGFPRSDSMTWVSCVPTLVEEYLEADGDLEDPLKATGAIYAYVSVDAEFFPRGREADARGELEDAIGTALEPNASGMVIGGGMGTQRAYSDLLLFDEAALDIVKRTLKERGLPKGTMIEFFAREHQSRRIAL